MMKMNELIVWFQKEYPEMVTDMMASNHHYENMDKLTQSSDVVEGSLRTPIDINPYHQEGDVWTHTMMVCKQAENMPYEVKIAALLHDIGKPDTREINPKNNHVMFLNHDAVSAFKAIEVLNRPELNLTKDQKVLIFNMIALHTQVFKQTREQLGRTCTDNSLLLTGLLALGHADHEGRFTNKPGEIPNLSEIQQWHRTRVYPENSKEVIILCGIPNSGKSTWVEKNVPDDSNVPGTVSVVSRDELIKLSNPSLTYNEAWKQANQNEIDKQLTQLFKLAKMSQFNTTIVDMTHMSKKSRAKSLSHFGSEYKRKCVVFLTDLPTIFKRNSEREGKVINRKVIEQMMTSFYPPTLDEFDEIEYIC